MKKLIAVCLISIAKYNSILSNYGQQCIFVDLKTKITKTLLIVQDLQENQLSHINWKESNPELRMPLHR